MKGTKLLSASAYEPVYAGPEATVRLAPEAHMAYLEVIEGTDEISVKRSAHLKRYFREFCDHREFYRRLNDEKFKKEGNFSDGKGGQVAVWTFKSWQWRLYGAILSVGGKRCFVGICVDASKKQNKANQQMLAKAAEGIAKLTEYRA